MRSDPRQASHFHQLIGENVMLVRAGRIEVLKVYKQTLAAIIYIRRKLHLWRRGFLLSLVGNLARLVLTVNYAFDAS